MMTMMHTMPWPLHVARRHVASWVLFNATKDKYKHRKPMLEYPDALLQDPRKLLGI